MASGRTWHLTIVMRACRRGSSRGLRRPRCPPRGCSGCTLTSPARAVVTTGAQILREGLQPGAVLTRVAQSHVRVGTFEFFANRGDTEAVRLLADYVIARRYPDATGAERPYRALLETVIDRTAELIASWQLIGFIHGVMNTDNLSIAGETIDYGPCAFMDTFHPATVYSSIDITGP